MKDPARLLDEGATTAELVLLRAGASEEPSEQAVRRLSAALGLASGAAVTTLAPKASAAGSVTRGLASKFAAKWMIVSAVGLTSGAAVLFVGSRVMREAPSGSGAAAPPAARQPEPVALSSAHGAVSGARGTSAPGPASDVVEPARKDAPRETRAVGARGGHEAPAAGASDRAGSPSIAGEIAALDGARRLLSNGDPAGALRALDEYEKATKSGVLRQEATLLRIEALASAGDLAMARRLGHRFLREHPRSPHEARIRALIGENP